MLYHNSAHVVFINRIIRGNTVVRKSSARKEGDVCIVALRDYKKGRSVSLFGAVTKLQLLGVKLMPVSLVMRVWMSQQKLWRRGKLPK